MNLGTMQAIKKIQIDAWYIKIENRFATLCLQNIRKEDDTSQLKDIMNITGERRQKKVLARKVDEVECNI